MLVRRRTRLIAALIAAGGCCALAIGVAAPETAAAAPGQARAEVERTTAQAPRNRADRVPIFALVRDNGAVDVLRGATGRSDIAGFARRMHAITGVLAAGFDGEAHAATVNDPLRPQQWALDAVDFEDAWTTSNGTGVKVAVLDTGVRADHQDLIGNVDNGANCLNASTSSGCASGAGAGDTDVYGHGTHVAGILDAHANNGLGIAGGAPGVHVIPVQVLDSTGSGSYAGIASGIIWATDNGAKVISMSLTGSDGSQGLLDAVNYALAHNVVVVAAAGNNYWLSGSGNTIVDNTPQYPASYPGVLSVGAIQNGSPYTRATFSNTSSNVGVVAPGSGIISTLDTTTSSYGYMSGTSMATPYVSAAAAVLLGANSSLTPAQVVNVLESTATPLASSGTGHGLINPLTALAALPSTTTTTTSTSSSTATTSPSTVPPSTTTTIDGSFGLTTTTTTPLAPPPPVPGYWVGGRNGQVRNFGVAWYGDRAGRTTSPMVAMAPSKSAKGYWVATANGAVYAFGDAPYKGSRAGLPLNKPIIAMTPSKSGNGYLLLGADGGIFTFGDAQFYGSTGAMKLRAPIVDFATTPTGKGYWLLGADGGVFTFGDAKFYGSTGAMRLAAPVVSMSPNPNGGYWLIARDGGVFTFGTNFYGSLVSRGVNKTVARLRVTPSGKGYWILATDGSVWTFGDAPERGWTKMNPAVDLAVG